jgi:uncharacterized protein Yka (UPF0111/DUF47 family)
MATLQSSGTFTLSAATEQNSMQECIENCNECHQLCLETISHYLNLDQKENDTQLLQILFDCAYICQVSADFLIRKSNCHAELCEVCAQICLKCADACNPMKDDQFKDCEEACRRCADTCQEMQTQH